MIISLYFKTSNYLFVVIIHLHFQYIPRMNNLSRQITINLKAFLAAKTKGHPAFP